MTDNTPAKKTRRSRAELEELMIQGGVEVLESFGVETQLSSISYAKVFDHLEKTQGVRVTYGSVHERIWNSLQEYQLAVIERAGVWNPGPADDERWADWLQTTIALSSTGAGETVRDAAASAARANYGARTSGFAPSPADATALVPAGAESDDLLATLSLAVADGLRLRTHLTGEPAGDPALGELAAAILRDWFQNRP